MKIFKVIAIIIVVIFCISLFIPWSPPRSIYSKYILDKDGVLENLNFKVNCTYREPTILLGKTNPEYECLSDGYLSPQKQSEIIKATQEFLLKNGWTLPEEPYFVGKEKFIYVKDDLRFEIKRWDSKGGLQKVYLDGLDPAQLLIIYQHMSNYKY